MSAPEMAPARSELRDSPAWFPLEVLAGGAVRLLRLDEAAYRSASFLDQRLLQEAFPRAQVTPQLLAAAAAGLIPCARYLFHTGHVGSTLLSRLLGAHEAFFSVREPALLRAAADTASQDSAAAESLPIEVTLALLGRSWRPQQRAVVKATSFVSEIADPILAMSGDAAAVFIFAGPLAYLRGILAGENSRAETQSLAARRLRRLLRRLRPPAWRFDPRSEGEQVAMSWLCEMLALQQAAAKRPGRILWVDFDAFLDAPLAGLARIFRSFGVDPAPGELEALLAGPIMRRYSKAPEHAYDAALRREVLASADWHHGEEIRRAARWLDAVAAEHAEVAALLEGLARRSR